jgi:hypothetical protein
MGALAVAVGMAVLPGAALADGSVSLVEFKVPDRAAIDKLNNMGADVTENVRAERWRPDRPDRGRRRPQGAA